MSLSTPLASRSAHALAWTLAAVAIGTAMAAALIGAGPVPWKLVLIPAFFAVPGLLVSAGRPTSPLGWLMLAVATLFAASAFATAWVEGGHRQGAEWAIWWVDRPGAIVVPCTLMILLLLPDGRLPSPRWRTLVAAAVGLQTALVVVWSIVRGPAAGPGSTWDVAPSSPVGLLPAAWGDALDGLDLWLLQAPLLLALVAIVIRIRRKEGDERRRLVSVLVATIVFVLLVVVGRLLWPWASDLLDVAGTALLAIAITSAVLRRHMHDVDVVVGHAFVYSVLTALIALGYVGVVAVAGSAGRNLPPLAVGMGTAVAALALLPLRGLLQRLLDRAIYGDAKDPSAAVKRLTDELVRSRQQIVTAREAERSRLRRDLHDELGPTLAGLSMQLGGLPEVVRKDPTMATARLARLETTARQALDDVRRLSRELRPPSLDELGLLPALRELAEQVGVELEADSDVELQLPPVVEVAAFRIAAEAITNTARHSGSTVVELRLDSTDDALVMRVVDHGRGVRGAATGVGRLTMRERAEELGGALVVRDTEGGGTTVEALLPISPMESTP